MALYHFSFSLQSYKRVNTITFIIRWAVLNAFLWEFFKFNPLFPCVAGDAGNIKENCRLKAFIRREEMARHTGKFGFVDLLASSAVSVLCPSELVVQQWGQTAEQLQGGSKERVQQNTESVGSLKGSRLSQPSKPRPVKLKSLCFLFVYLKIRKSLLIS